MTKLLIYDAPWAPIFCLRALNLILCLVSFIKIITIGHFIAPYIVPLALNLLLLTGIFWNRDCARESALGTINDNKSYNIKIGILLFLLSEAFFFIRFFWIFIRSVLAPELRFWPPTNLKIPRFIGAPSLNTILLVASRATVTLSHYEKDSRSYATFGWLILTLIISFLFLTVQYIEYLSLPFSFTSGIGGSIFFIATGFHGSHVILGSFLLLSCAYLLFKNFYSKNSILRYELAIWYWHFVDAIWLILYTIFYCWGH